MVFVWIIKAILYAGYNGAYGLYSSLLDIITSKGLLITSKGLVLSHLVCQ